MRVVTVAKVGFVGGVGRGGEVAFFPEVLQLLVWRGYRAQEGMASRGLNGIQLMKSLVCIGAPIDRRVQTRMSGAWECYQYSGVLINVLTVHSQTYQRDVGMSDRVTVHKAT